ncbi:hypothetical protein RND81_14G171200 [Saponaria officinalis]|uniref:Auxin-responsive protein n=1 Tax=Saponaria officinalis TaxID=3572 RepID=A0AAW1GT95_SAPOF
MPNSEFELAITELRLGLPGGTNIEEAEKKKKRVFSESQKGNVGPTINKGVAVGWPPVNSYRRKSFGSEKECIIEASNNNTKRFVKISMDGVPFLRKIDVFCYHEYSHFVGAFDNLFACSGLKETLEDGENSDQYVLIYEDKDGDWLLLGDVPWDMFVESCKRLRIMKSGDANGFELQCKKKFRG